MDPRPRNIGGRRKAKGHLLSPLHSNTNTNPPNLIYFNCIDLGNYSGI